MRLRRYTEDLKLQEIWLTGYYGKSTVIEWKNRSFVLSAGSSDSLEFYRDLDDPEVLYVLTRNYGLGYIGVERLDHYLNEPVPRNEGYVRADDTDSFFTQSPYEDKPEGVPLLDMTEPNAIRWIVNEY